MAVDFDKVRKAAMSTPIPPGTDPFLAKIMEQAKKPVTDVIVNALMEYHKQLEQGQK